MNAPAFTRGMDQLPAWVHPVTGKHWTVMVYGGTDPRTGFAQEPQEFEFFAGHYTKAQIIQRAEGLAEQQHRDKFMIRDCSGSVIHGENELREAYLRMLDQGLRKHSREERRSYRGVAK